MFQCSIKMLLASRNNTSCIIMNIATYMRNEWQVWTYIILSENYLPIFFPVMSALIELHRKKFVALVHVYSYFTNCSGRPCLLSNSPVTLPKQKGVVAPSWKWVMSSLPRRKRTGGLNAPLWMKLCTCGFFLLSDHYAVLVGCPSWFICICRCYRGLLCNLPWFVVQICQINQNWPVICHPIF